MSGNLTRDAKILYNRFMFFTIIMKVFFLTFIALTIFSSFLNANDFVKPKQAHNINRNTKHKQNGIKHAPAPKKAQVVAATKATTAKQAKTTPSYMEFANEPELITNEKPKEKMKIKSEPAIHRITEGEILSIIDDQRITKQFAIITCAFEGYEKRIYKDGGNDKMNVGCGQQIHLIRSEIERAKVLVFGISLDRSYELTVEHIETDAVRALKKLPVVTTEQLFGLMLFAYQLGSGGFEKTNAYKAFLAKSKQIKQEMIANPDNFDAEKAIKELQDVIDSKEFLQSLLNCTGKGKMSGGMRKRYILEWITIQKRPELAKYKAQITNAIASVDDYNDISQLKDVQKAFSKVYDDVKKAIKA